MTMQLTINRANLLEALTKAVRAADARAVIPILSHVLLEASGDAVTLTASDLELFLHTRVPATVDTPGSLAVPARVFLDVVRAMPGVDVRLAAADGSRLAVTSGKTKMHVVGLGGDDPYPAFPTTDGAPSLTVPGAALRAALKRTQFAVADPHSGKPFLMGVRMHWDGTQLTLAATDTYRMAHVTISDGVQSDAPTIVCTLPPRLIGEVLRQTSAEAYTLSVSDAVVQVDDGATCFLGRLVEGQFPNIAFLFGQPYAARCAVPVDALKVALQRALIVTRSDESKSVTLDIAGDVLCVQSASAAVGDAAEELDVASIEGAAPLRIAFNPTFLSQVLDAVTSGSVILAGEAYNKPLRMRFTDEDDYVYLVTPLVTQAVTAESSRRAS